MFVLVLREQIIYKVGLLAFFIITFQQEVVNRCADLEFKYYYPTAIGITNIYLLKTPMTAIYLKNGQY